MKSRSLRNAIVHRLLLLTGFDIKSEYISAAPSHQNAIDLFRGEWASRLPGPYESGEHDLFNDSRISWLVNELGGVQDMNVLDCGPLEGGHTYALEHAGADVLGVEANTRAFLRCLVAKEVLAMRSRFQLGDFLALLRSPARFDLIVASGVLYHLTNPVDAIALAAQATDRLYLWTHYFDRDHLSPTLRFDEPHTETVRDFRHTLHRQHYQSRLGNRGFFGGAHDTSCWLERSDLLNALAFFGFDDVRVQFDHQVAEPGPSIALLARRGGSAAT